MWNQLKNLYQTSYKHNAMDSSFVVQFDLLNK